MKEAQDLRTKRMIKFIYCFYTLHIILFNIKIILFFAKKLNCTIFFFFENNILSLNYHHHLNHFSFALTTHKTQSISLSSVSISLDSEMFSPGQAYVALSRCTSWENLQIVSFDKNAIITDKSMIQEYNRLKEKTSTPLPL